MTYTIQTSSGEKIGVRTYFSHSAALSVARRMIGKWKKSNALRGSGMKIVSDDGSLYGQKVVEWLVAE